MARYIDAVKLDELMENRKVKGDCKFCNKYERCLKNGINRKGSHLYCWEKIELPTADVVEVVRCKDCKYKTFEQANNIIHCDRDKKHGTRFFKPDDFCSYGQRK